MKLTEPVSEDHMVAAFLKAEIQRDCFREYLQALGGDSALIDAPDLTDEFANGMRRRLLLACRGGLFRAWPDDVLWWKVQVAPAELANFRFIYYPAWNEFSSGSRLVRDSVANVNRIENPGAKVKELAQLVRQGRRFPDLVLVATTRTAPVVIMEGNTRAAAYALAGSDAPNPISALAGFSPNFAAWPFLGRLSGDGT